MKMKFSLGVVMALFFLAITTSPVTFASTTDADVVPDEITTALVGPATPAIVAGTGFDLVLRLDVVEDIAFTESTTGIAGAKTIPRTSAIEMDTVIDPVKVTGLGTYVELTYTDAATIGTNMVFDTQVVADTTDILKGMGIVIPFAIIGGLMLAMGGAFVKTFHRKIPLFGAGHTDPLRGTTTSPPSRTTVGLADHAPRATPTSQHP